MNLNEIANELLDCNKVQFSGVKINEIYNSYWTFHLLTLLIFFQIGCFLHWIQSVYPHLFCSLYDNGSPLYLWSPSGLLCWLIFIVPKVVLNLVYLSIFSGLAALMSADIARNLWSLVCSCLNSYWTFHLFPLLIFFQIGCFLHWIQSVYPHLFCSLYDNGSPLYLWSPSGLLCLWIFIVPEVVLNLVYLSIFSGLAALMSADIARNLWSLVCTCLNSYWTFHLFPLLIFFSNWLLSALNSICLHHLFCSLYDNGSPLYLWSPSGLLCWWIFIVPEVVLNLVYLSIFSGLAAPMSADIARNLWSLVCSCLNSYWTFHLFPLLIFFQIGCFLHWIQSVYPHLFCSLDDNGSPLYLWSPSGLLCWWIFIVPEVLLNLVYLSIFSGLAALMSADIPRNLWSLVCSCLNSYWTFHLFPLLIFFSNWLLSALNSICFPHLFCSLYDNGSRLYLWLLSGLLCWWIFIVPEVVLNLVYLSSFSGLAAPMSADIARNLWSLVCSCLNSYWTFHLLPLLIFFSNWLLSALNSICLPHLFCSLYDNGSPLYLWLLSGLLCWWIFIVLEVVLNLVYLSIFSGLAAPMSADIARNLWSLVCSCLNSYWTFHLFPLLIFFFKLAAFCTEFNLFTPICFILFMIMDLPYICDHQVGYSAGGYSLSPRWFLTWYNYPFFQDKLHWWVLILHETYDHWSVAVLTVTEHFIYSHFWFFFKLVAFCTEFNLFIPICFVLFW